MGLFCGDPAQHVVIDRISTGVHAQVRRPGGRDAGDGLGVGWSTGLDIHAIQTTARIYLLACARQRYSLLAACAIIDETVNLAKDLPAS